MVNVTDGSHVYVGLSAVELFFGHCLVCLEFVVVGKWRGDWWSPRADLNRRPRPYQGRALPTELQGRSDAAGSCVKEGFR